MRIVIIGGHFSPALSLIEQLAGNEIFVIGRKYTFEGDKTESYEYKVCAGRHITFIELRTGRLQRRFSTHTVPSLLKTSYGYIQALLILRKIKPDIVVGFGGYVSLPVCFAARHLRIPILIHEQTQGAGLANRIIGRFATKVALSFEASRKYFSPKKIVMTGNPIRSEVFEIKEKIKIDTTKPLLYVTGGSGGSHAINLLIGALLDKLLMHYSIIHQTGDSSFNDYERLAEQKNRLPDMLKDRYVVQRFISLEEIGWVMKHANLIISRSGINTVSELLTLHKKSILIPLPHGQKNEQMANAQLAKNEGIAEILEQSEATPDKLLSLITYMMEHADNYARPNHSYEHFQKAGKNLLTVLQSIHAKKS